MGLRGYPFILVLPSGPESGEGSQYQNPLYLSISLYPGAKGYCSEKNGCKDGFVISVSVKLNSHFVQSKASQIVEKIDEQSLVDRHEIST